VIVQLTLVLTPTLGTRNTARWESVWPKQSWRANLTHQTHDPGWARSSSSTVSPPSYTDTVPEEAEITTAVASVTVVMARAAA
jgi:hypothetical protein